METETKQLYKISWQTEIIDNEPFGAGTQRIPIAGWTMIEADSFEDAEGIADGLVDVDFFGPEQKVSASSREVLMGRMWRTRQPERELPSLDSLLPGVHEWNFDNIEITGIVKVQP